MIEHAPRQTAHTAFTEGFYGSDFDFEVRIQLGMAPYGGADAGEVLRTIATVDDGDTEAWFRAWEGLARRLRTLAEESVRGKHRVSAAGAYLRAANAFAVAVNAAMALDDDDRLLACFRAHRGAWEGFVDNQSYRAERLAIPYQDTTLPGYLFLAADDGEPRPLLILVNGSDGAVSGLWATGASGALQRGYHVLVFDGPGQQTLLFEHGIPFRHDWESVLTPVVDAVIARGDIDAQRIAAYGISQAGYWLPRALAFEHRIAAALVDPGVVDVSESWLAHFPPEEIALFDAGAKEEFDESMAVGLAQSPALARTWSFRARPYGKTSPYETVVEMRRYRLDPEDAARIRTPLWIASPQKEQFWPGQSERLAQLVSDAVVQEFTTDEGADYHCQPMGRLLTDQRMFDWLDARLGRARS